MQRLQAPRPTPSGGGEGACSFAADNTASSDQTLLDQKSSSICNSCCGNCKVTSHTMQVQDKFATHDKTWAVDC